MADTHDGRHKGRKSRCGVRCKTVVQLLLVNQKLGRLRLTAAPFPTFI